MLDTLITLMSTNLKRFLTSVQPLFNILSSPISSLITTKDVKKGFSLFPPSSDMSKVTDFDGSLCEINILRQQTDHYTTLTEIAEYCTEILVIN